MITESDAEFLFKAARAAIKGEKFNNKFPESLDERTGIFVTLYTYPNKELRGCIGFPEPMHSLITGVREAAKAAAYDDYRFEPLRPEEFNHIILEISILTKPLPCKLDDIEEGDGVILHKNSKSALFLPQVWEHFSGKEEFLDQLCLKAGLNVGDWKDAKFMKFSVVSFEETEPNGKLKQIL
ncbi:MAG: AmmeMemoRadiSam system protein A [Candidatus Nanoarchaeia archaeon]|nr:AmmeMemoRadiSam system protein A [Candidatus Nanoarchaeia archaeon]MDD5239368.1 AmmeMemoRadiSam system protein A [Candidatus Nanoarchaeia archaeon]